MSVTTTAPTVRLAPGEESGLAALVAQYLTQTFAQEEAKGRSVRELRGRIAVTALDHGASATLDLGGDEIVVHGGVVRPVDTTVAATYPVLLDLLRGEAHPLRDHLHGRLRVRVDPRHPLLPLRLYRLLRLEGEPRPERRRRLLTATLVAGVAAVALAAAWRLAHRRGRP